MTKFNLNICFLSLIFMLVPNHLVAKPVTIQAIEKLAHHEALTVQEKQSLFQTIGTVIGGLLVVGTGITATCLLYKKCFKLASIAGTQDEATETDQNLIERNQEFVGANPPPAPAQPAPGYRGKRLEMAIIQEQQSGHQSNNQTPAAAFAYIPVNGNLRANLRSVASVAPSAAQPAAGEQSEIERLMARSLASRKNAFAADGSPK